MRDKAALFAGLALAVAPVSPACAQSAESAARAYLQRIAAVNDVGPQLNAVIVVNPDAPKEAAAAERAGLPLAGRTVLVKDNIETREWPTTAGSLALAGNETGRDAPLIARLRAAGGVVLGKTNLSEWANIRSSNATSGWSAIGGLTRNPYALDRNACGSSSGSAAAVAAGLAWAAIGTETDGSITCPASVNGVVGFKPTVGLVSRTYVVPISHSQDTPGPLARSVHDAALLLNAIRGADSADPATEPTEPVARGKWNQEMGRMLALTADLTSGLSNASLKGFRIGVLRKQVGTDPKVAALFEQALTDLRKAGAVLVDIDYDIPDALGKDETAVLQFELREDLGSYLKGSPAPIPIRSLADAIAFDRAHAREEMRWFGQDFFEAAEQATDRAAYDKARAESLRLAGAEGIDKLLADNKVRFLIAPTAPPAWTSDLLDGDHYDGSVGAGTLPAVAGYPHLSVPMGAVEGLPVGLSIIGGKWDDADVLRAGAAYERARSATLPTPSLERWKAAN